MILSRHVESFIAVARYKSMKAAADSLFISTSALSQQMKLLEQEVGVPLFRRSYNGMVLTASGEVFLEKMKQLKALEEEAKKLAVQAAGVTPQTLSIAYTHNIERKELLDLYRLLKRDYHQELELFAVPYKNAIQKTREGTYDACFVPYGDHLAKSGLKTQTIRIDRPFLSMPHSHPLAGKEWISRRELDGMELVLPEKGLFQITDAVYDEIQSFGLKPKITVITDLLQSELYCQIHCAARICSGQPLTPDMLVVPFETDAVSRLCLAYKPDQETAARLRHLLSLIARQQEEKKQAQERG